MSKGYAPQEDWYLAMLLEDCDYAIEAEEDFADGGPSPDDIRSLIMELQERRGVKMKACSSCHLGGEDIVRKCLDCKGEGFVRVMPPEPEWLIKLKQNHYEHCTLIVYADEPGAPRCSCGGKKLPEAFVRIMKEKKQQGMMQWLKNIWYWFFGNPNYMGFLDPKDFIARIPAHIIRSSFDCDECESVCEVIHIAPKKSGYMNGFYCIKHEPSTILAGWERRVIEKETKHGL